MTTEKSNGSVRIEIFEREDCPHRGMALVVVERVVDETGIPAEIEVVEVESDSDAESYRVLGSPTVLVDGRDVDPEPIPVDYSVDDRIYRTPRGPSGWPEPDWIRAALIRAVAQTHVSNGRVSLATTSVSRSFGHEPVEHAVDPLVVPPVRLSAHALAREARTLCMAHRALVEPVDLHLKPVEVELVEEVPLEESCGRVGDLRTAEIRVHGETAEGGDSAAAIRALEAHRARALAVDLDHEDAVRLGLRLPAHDLLEDLVAPLRPHGCEERLDVLVAHELDEEVDVVRCRPANRDRHVADSGTRTPKKRWPDASAAPTAMSANPASIAAVTGSSSRTAPYTTANAGMR